jgi:hypothetical protein
MPVVLMSAITTVRSVREIKSLARHPPPTSTTLKSSCQTTLRNRARLIIGRPFETLAPRTL